MASPHSEPPPNRCPGVLSVNSLHCETVINVRKWFGMDKEDKAKSPEPTVMNPTSYSHKCSRLEVIAWSFCLHPAQEAESLRMDFSRTLGPGYGCLAWPFVFWQTLKVKPKTGPNASKRSAGEMWVDRKPGTPENPPACRRVLWIVLVSIACVGFNLRFVSPRGFFDGLTPPPLEK